jgi:hypothetical protein
VTYQKLIVQCASGSKDVLTIHYHSTKRLPACKFVNFWADNFDQLTPPEQELWNLFVTSDIFEFLTGQKDTVAEFKKFLTFASAPKVNIDITKIAQKLTPEQVPVAIQRALSVPSPAAHNLCQRKDKTDYRSLHLGQEIKHDIQQAAQEAKEKCKSMRKSVQKSTKAAVTKRWDGV